MTRLDEHLASDEDLWRLWSDYGVTENSTLTVDVSFYTKNKHGAEQIADCLRQWGISEIEVKIRRTYLFFKGWEIWGEETGQWSLAKLQDRTRRYVKLAETWNAIYEGCGAMIPKNESP